MKLLNFLNETFNPFVGFRFDDINNIDVNYIKNLKKRGGIDKFLLNWLIFFLIFLLITDIIPFKTFVNNIFILSMEFLFFLCIFSLGVLKFLLINMKNKENDIENWIEKIKAEREKQISKNGYKPEHDDEHTDGSIADAAAHYASCSESNLYPWDKNYDTKDNHSREEQLVIACAMCIAELERLDRAKTKRG